jgi:hypothetical protein
LILSLCCAGMAVTTTLASARTAAALTASH